MKENKRKQYCVAQVLWSPELFELYLDILFSMPIAFYSASYPCMYIRKVNINT